MGERTPVGNWLDERFRKWADQPGGRTVTRWFADYLGVDEKLLGSWMAPKKRGAPKDPPEPSGESVVRIGNKLGPEIYDIMGWPRPNCYEE